MKPAFTPATLARIVLAVGGAGCGISLDGYAPLDCAPDGQTPALLSGLVLAEPADYLELRTRMSFSGDGPWEMVDQAGTACATATDAEACEAALAAATATEGFPLGQCVQVCSDYILVVNRGDTVEVISDADALLTALGAVDSEAEAALVVGNARFALACHDVQRGGVRPADEGFEVIATRTTSDCSPIIQERFQLSVSADGVVTELDSEVVSQSPACIGRRPGGLEPGGSSADCDDVVGAWLAGVARLESAAVYAFSELDADLAAHGAPAELRAQVAGARRDELRHTRDMARIARRFGGRPTAPRVTPRPIRSLVDLALENATEGCVRETFGALVGMWQGNTAADPDIRATMTQIGADEARHAALSWAIAAWAEAQLDPAARARVAAARSEALAALQREVAAPVAEPLVRVAGVPSATVQRELAARLAEAIAAIPTPATH